MNYLLRYLEPLRSEADGGGTGALTDAPAPETTQLDAPEPESTPEPEENDDDYEDYDFGEKKLKLPKDFAKHVKEGTLREQDYRFKTGETAAEKKAAAEARAQYTEALKTVQERLKATEPPKPDPAMLDPASEKYDRDEYYRRRDIHEQWNERMTAAKNAQAEEEGKTKAEQTKARQAYLAKENDALVKAIPEWKDPVKRAAGMTEIAQHAAELGVSQQEWAALDDHRLLVALRESKLYRASLKGAQVADAAQPVGAAKPAPLVIKGRGQGGAGAAPNPAKMSTEQYMEWRNKQLRAKRG